MTRRSMRTCILAIAWIATAWRMDTSAQVPAKQLLPADAIARLGSTRLAAPRGTGIALSPDGKLLASGCGTSEHWQHDAIIWDSDTETRDQGRGARDEGRAEDRSPPIAFSRPSSLAPLVGSRPTWLAADGSQFGYFDARGRIHYSAFGHGFGYQSDLRWAAISPDGTLLARSVQGAILLWDLARPLADKAALPAPKTAREAETLWDVLGDDDPLNSDWALVAAPDVTVKLLKTRLTPVRPPDAVRVKTLIANLDSANFNIRDTANRELLREREPLLPTLREALKSARSLEHRRIETVIDELQSGINTPGTIRSGLRATSGPWRCWSASAHTRRAS